MIKVFGIGNILLGDDGIGVYIIDKIKTDLLNFDKRLEVIIGETDYLYCINEIKKDDIVIIVDSAYFDKEIGSLSIFKLEECNEFILNKELCHEESLLSILIKEKPYIKGYLIGVEVDILQYSLSLSHNTHNKFEYICREVIKSIKKIIVEEFTI